MSDYLCLDWETKEFADLLFGDYLSRDDKVRVTLRRGVLNKAV